MIRVALIGNPNVGKTAIFNNLTGSRQHVGNWPGVTVEKKTGRCTHRETEMEIVDLPGTYSLEADAIDERIARDYIIDEKPDVVVDIVDASNIERNLYLTLLLLELGANVVVALNKMDIAASKNYEFDIKELSLLLGVPVIPTVATTQSGMGELRDAILSAAVRREKHRKVTIGYSDDIEARIKEVEDLILTDTYLANTYPPRWLAIKLLEKDESVMARISSSPKRDQILEVTGRVEVNADTFAEERYRAIDRILHASLRGRRDHALTTSDLLDRVFLHKRLGIPVFLTLMWATFQFAFKVSEPFMVMLERIFGWLGGLLGEPTTPLISLWADGICGGLGFVLVFIFPIMFLFIALAILEDSGYLPRAAFVMDRLMYRIGLHGRSFIPMLMGFGCNLPAIMATRSIGDEKDRLITILINPLMSCGARLPVYVLIAGALFGTYAGSAIFSMYVLGIALAILMALLFRRFIPGLKGKPAPFIMELPPYARPAIKSVLLYMWSRAVVFLKKAGTILLGGALVLWFMASFPWGREIESSYAGILGHTLEPLLAPLGFDWMAAIALFFGFLAKEIVVETFGILYGVGGEDAITGAVAAHMTPVTGLAFMAFTLIYLPCLATVGIVRAETGSWKWTGFMVLYQLVLAYVVAGIIVLTGNLITGVL